MSNCHTSGNITANPSPNWVLIGNLIGYNSDGDITECYTSGSVTSNTTPTLAGGLIGRVYIGNVSNCYSVSTVKADRLNEGAAGGLIGKLDYNVKVSDCYATGLNSTSNKYNFGGLVGALNSGSVESSYHNYNNKENNVGTYCTNEQLKNRATYTNWDFTNTWSIYSTLNSGYPFLSKNRTNFAEEIIKVESVTFDNSAVNMTTGETIKLVATVLPSNATEPNLSWATSDETVATVNNGLVTALKAGTIVVTATSTDGSNKLAICTILVQDPKVQEEPVVKVSSLKISGISRQIAAGKKVKLTCNVLPANAANKEITWETGNKKYAMVDKNGVVTVKKAGSGKYVTITALANYGSGIKATYKIKIMKHAVKSIKLSYNAKTLKAGKTIQINSSVITTGKNANKVLSWSSSNTAYATVDKKGKVKIKKGGKGKTVIITAKSTDGSDKKASVKLTIKAK